MKEVKCDCGHINPFGTKICGKCGMVLDSEKENKLIDMRYEGSARRSQTYKKTIIDKIWNFFSSVKVGVTLIVIALIASAIGTILPQEMYIPSTATPAEHYELEYGWFGKVYYGLGFHNLYSSWWYLIIIGMLGISLLIASIDRFFPLYRSLKKQGITRHDGFMKRQRIYGVTKLDDHDINLDKVKAGLKRQRYHIREENGHILAEKNRFSRWGPYVNHIGLIIFLIGALLRSVPGMYIDKVVWLREGERKEIPGTNGEYYLKNNEFTLEVYDKGNKEDEQYSAAIDKTGTIAKTYQSDVTLYERKGDALPGEKVDLEKVKDYKIKVNEPLKHDHYSLYQVDYKLDELSTMAFNLINKKTEEKFGGVKIDLNNPQKRYELNKGYSVDLISYFPDFEFDEKGEPRTISKIPNNPAFIFKMHTPDKPEGEVSFVAIKETAEPLGENTYKMAFNGVETQDVTALTVRKDLTLWILFTGGIIFMVGVVQGSYWNHRRIWIKRKQDEIVMAGHTNKNWHGIKRDIKKAIESTSLSEPTDQLEEEKSSTKGEVLNG
ncbi:cytochrome C biogenesis protein [Peribacillus muralis]|uniref:cytochrome c biogenesis protein ResB n=1 Tax=Peribacillus muralis TaxID=264697 RepID=UPI001F4EDD80|nr:cytochrome c biogenesis protein ResB [Peribacillus muralis]MCK1991364.1 cytochrome c biogenesis protein ResB [Peribacillus muralis]MCK2011919.1 cytochrome c biogenesis protein ResB [Peribacillus muralis]